jgi:hypothetical protein
MTTPTDTFDVVRKATEAALANPQSSTQETVGAMARVLHELTPDYLLSALPVHRKSELCGLSVQEIATELVEDIFLQWAANLLATSPQGVAGVAERREVARVLGRATKTPEVAEHLLEKLERFLQATDFPHDAHEQVRQELRWNLSSREKKYEHLIRLRLFSEAEFFHLTAFIEESENENDIARAKELALRYCELYFDSLELAPLLVRGEWLARVPELLQAAVALHFVELIRAMAAGLSKELLRELDPGYHAAVAAHLSSIAQNAASYDDFETALKIGSALEKSLGRNSAQHAACCGKALGNLLTPQTVESLIELAIHKIDDPSVSKTTLCLLRLAAAEVGEIALELLEREADVPKRLRILRLAGRLGHRAVEGVRRKLADERWYMVRNACSVLAALHDPELCRQLEPALRHSDSRVQRAALAALIAARPSHLAATLVAALPALPPDLQDAALNELLLLKDPSIVPALEKFAAGAKAAKMGLLLKIVEILSAIHAEPGAQALAKFLFETGQPLPLRKAALSGLAQSSVPLAHQLLADFARLNPNDSLAPQCLKASTAQENRASL